MLRISAAVVRDKNHAEAPVGELRTDGHSLEIVHPTQSLEKQMETARQTEAEFLQDLIDRCSGDVDKLTAKHVAQAAAEGNEVAREVIEHAAVALGWAVAQVITLLAIETVVIGGGVSLIGETHFFAPLRQSVDRYVFPPLAKTYRIVPASLGENVVVIGALAIAHDACAKRP